MKFAKQLVCFVIMLCVMGGFQQGVDAQGNSAAEKIAKESYIFSKFMGSDFSWDDINANMLPTPGNRNMLADITEDFVKDNHLFNMGINHTYLINKNSYIKTSFGLSNDGIRNKIFESKVITSENIDGNIIYDTINRMLNYTSNFKSSAYKGAILYSIKIDAKNNQSGGIGNIL